MSYQTPYKVSRIETISKHCIDIQRIGYVECIPESYRLNVGNILFSNINSIQYIGNTAYLDKDYGLYHGMNLLRIIPNTTIVRPRFLHLLLCTDWAINHFQTICNKAVSQASINQTALGKSRFPIPPMSVQQQICSMFELTERKLDNEQEYISCLQQQKRYLLQKNVYINIRLNRYFFNKMYCSVNDFSFAKRQCKASRVLAICPCFSKLGSKNFIFIKSFF